LRSKLSIPPKPLKYFIARAYDGELSNQG
jgi:hypothetical protein